MQRVTSIEALYNFIATVVLCAPDRFMRRDYLHEDDQLDLDKAFEELHHGITLLHPEVGTPEKVQLMNSILDDAYTAYKTGDRKRGAHLVQDFQDLIFQRED